MYLLKKGIQVADILQATVDVIQVDVEVLTKEEVINTQVQATITVDTNIRPCDRNTAANKSIAAIGAGR